MESVLRFFLMTDLRKVGQTGMVIFITVQLIALATFYNYLTITGKSVWPLRARYGNAVDTSTLGFKLKPQVVPRKPDSNPVYSIRIAEEMRILRFFEKSYQSHKSEEQKTQIDEKEMGGQRSKKKKKVSKKTVVKVSTTKVGKMLHHKPGYPIFYRDKDLKTLPPITTKDGPIPHIIHQTWKNYNIPFKFQESVRSWAKKHPRWQYWFWTDQDADAFMRKRFPQHHRLFTSYRKPILKADAIRYFILYEFGGVYADLDMEALRSIDIFTRKHYCFLASEPFLHAAFYGVNGMEYIACNALMGAVPKHSFFRMIIDNLADRFRKQKYVLAQTGPKMVTDILNIYRNRTEYKREDTVYLADPKHFMPQPAEDNAKQIQEWCKTGKIIKTNMTRTQKRLCVSLKINKRKSLLQSVLPNDTYTVHKWTHTYHRGFQIDRLRMQSIAMLIPHVSNVKKIIGSMKQV